MTLLFHNTLTRKKQVFKPIKKGHVGLYTCGPTVYNYPHIGNYRAYLFEDLLRRHLEYKNYKVLHVMNLTDVDDKTIRDSQKEHTKLTTFTERYAKAFFEDINTLNILPAHHYPRATDFIKEMINIIKELIKKKKAYITKDGCVYYEITTYKKYGQLASLDPTQLQAGASGRIQHDEYDRDHPQDFALWKAWTPEDGDVKWNSPWGEGRPGWHIECSAMSAKYLGWQFDIHTGGVDNIFPHHQNEIAQTEGYTGKKFVNYWLHCEHLLVDGKKMSKSLGNFYTLRDILSKGYTPKAIRWALLATHYRQKLNFSFENLTAAQSAIDRIHDFARKLNVYTGNQDNKKIPLLLTKTKKTFEKALDDDLDISKALAALFDMITAINTHLMNGTISTKDARSTLTRLKELDNVLGILEKQDIPQHIQHLVNEREQARTTKDWKKSDELRNTLKTQGYTIDDTPSGPVVKKN